MIESASGLILRTRRLTETSLIIHWLTPNLGRLATVAKGALRPKSPFRGKLDLFYIAEFSFVRSRRSELHTLREVGVRETHPAIRRELGRLQQASYAAALVEQVTETETPLAEIFELVREFLSVLGQRHDVEWASAKPAEAATPYVGRAPPPDVGGYGQAHFVFAFELKLLEELGLEPDLSKSHLTAGAREIVKMLTQQDWSAISKLKMSSAQTTELSQFLHGFLIFHLGKIPAGRFAAVQS
jgi:recombinational DNA repair protein (RecF pathway)